MSRAYEDPLDNLRAYLRPEPLYHFNYWAANGKWSTIMNKNITFVLTPTEPDKETMQWRCARDVELALVGLEVSAVFSSSCWTAIDEGGVLWGGAARRERSTDGGPSPPLKIYKKQTKAQINGERAHARHTSDEAGKRARNDLVRLTTAHAAYGRSTQAQERAQLAALDALVLDKAVELFGAEHNRAELERDLSELLARQGTGQRGVRGGRLNQSQWGQACGRAFDASELLRARDKWGMTQYMRGEEGVAQRIEAAAAGYRASVAANGRRPPTRKGGA